jgi:hypothetical protein
MTTPAPEGKGGPLTRVSPPKRTGDDRRPSPPWRVEGAPPGGGGDASKRRPAWMRFGWMLLILLALNWIISSFLLAPPARTAVSYTFFLTQVQAKNISEITSTGDTIEGDFTKKAAYTPTSTNGETAKTVQVDRFTTQRPSFANDNLFAMLQANGVPVNANPPDAPAPLWQRIVVGLLPTLLLVGLLFSINPSPARGPRSRTSPASRRWSRRSPRSSTSSASRRSTASSAPRSRTACCSPVRPAPARRCWPARWPARRRCRSSRCPLRSSSR